MAEVIKTILTADSSELRREYEKAAATVQSYQQKVEAAHAGVRSNFRAEQQALKLEATGQQAAAAALREKVSLQAQALKLAAAANIDEGMALRLLQSRAALQKQITANAQKAPVGLPSAGPVPLTKFDLMGQDITKARGNYMKRQMELAGQGAKNGSMGFLAFSQAVEDSQYGLNGILNNIPQMVMGFGGSMGLAGSISLAAVALYSYYKLSGEITGDAGLQAYAKNQAAAWKEYDEAVGNARMSLAKSQRETVLKDEAANQLEKETARLKTLLGYDESRFRKLDQQTQKIREQSGQVQELEKAWQQARLNQASTPAEKQKMEASFAKQNQQRETQRLTNEIAVAQSRISLAAKDYQKTWDAIGLSVTTYNSALVKSKGELDEAQTALMEYEQQQAYLKKSLSTEKKHGDGADRKEDQQALNFVAEQVAAYGKLVEAKKLEIQKNEALLATTKAEGEASKKALDEKLRAANEQKDLLDSELKQRKALWAITEAAAAAEKARLDATQKAEKSAFAQELEIIRARAAGNNKQAEALQEQKDIQDLTKQIMEQQGVSFAAANRMATQRVRLEKEAATFKERQEKQKNQNMARADIAGEISIMRLRLNGQNAKADSLQREIQMRHEAMSLAVELGITEKQALTVLRERARLEKELQKQKTAAGENSRIRRNGSRMNAAGGRRINAGGGRRIDAGAGIRNRQLQDRERARQQGVPKANPEEQYWDRQLNLQEQLLGVFKKFGVV